MSRRAEADSRIRGRVLAGNLRPGRYAEADRAAPQPEIAKVLNIDVKAKLDDLGVDPAAAARVSPVSENRDAKWGGLKRPTSNSVR
jgi:hypothetical protein